MTNLTIEEISLLQKVEREPDLKPYFFKKIKNIKWFESLDEAGFFSLEEMPEIIQNTDGSYRFPHWPAIEYLIKASESLFQKEELIPKFLSIIRVCTEKNSQNPYSNSYLLLNFAKIYRNIPVDSLTLADIELVEMWFSDIRNFDYVSDDVAQILLSALDNISLDNKEKNLKLLSILFKVKRVEPNTGTQPEVSINLKSHRKDELIVAIGQKVGAVLDKEGINTLLSSLSVAVEIIKADDYSNIWRSAIEEHNQNSSYREDEDILIVVCREALDGYFKVAVDVDRVALLKGLLGHHYSIIKRIAIHTYSNYFDKVGNVLLNELLKVEFFKSNFRHEMWHLLKDNYNEFTDDQKQELLHLIEEQSLKEDGSISYYNQAEWLIAISNYEDKLSEKLNYAVQKIGGVVPEHPDFTSYTSSVRWGSGESPIPLEQLKETARRSIEQLIDLLNNYRPPENTYKFESGKEELVKCFKKFVIDEAEEIYFELHRFERISIPFVYEIIQAFSDIWKDPKKSRLDWNLVWPSLLDFIKNILTKGDFWEEETDNGHPFVGTKTWLVASTCRLIEAGCKNDKHSFAIGHIEKSKAILLNILEHQDSRDISFDSDAVGVSINSNRGQCLEALINLALFECRFSNRKNKEHQSVWLEYSRFFTKELIEVKSLEFRTLAPMYITNFKWLSQEWFEENFNVFFTDELDISCVCSLQGYAQNNYLDPLMYEYLKRSNNFEHILDHESLGKKIERRYITFGLIPYVFNDEALSDEYGLSYQLIQRNVAKEFKEIIYLFRSSFAHANNIDKKAIELFPIVFNRFDNKSLEGKKLISHLVDWARFLDFSNEKHIDWIIDVAPYAELEHNSHDFIKVIEKISNVSPACAIKVWMSLLTTVPSYPYPENSYINIYKNLINSGFERDVKQIVDKYIKYGLQQPADWYRMAHEEIKNNE